MDAVQGYKGLERLRCPEQHFLMDDPDLVKPQIKAGLVKMALNEHKTEATMTFRLQDVGTRWDDILDPLWHLPFTSIHWTVALSWNFLRDIWIWSAIRMSEMTLSRAYIEAYRKVVTLVDVTTSLTSTLSVTHVGRTSFVLAITVRRSEDNLEICFCKFLQVYFDPKRREAKRLPQQWKENVLKHSRLSSVKVEMPVMPTEYVALSDAELRMHEHFMDANGHVNFKVYLLFTMACLRKYLLINQDPALATDHNVTLENITCVYERECMAGDMMTCQLVRPQSPESPLDAWSLYAPLYKDGLKLAYCRFMMRRAPSKL